MRKQGETDSDQGDMRFTRRGFLASAGAAALSYVVLPGIGRVRARPFEPASRAEDYTGRLCYNENPLGPSPAALAAMQDACTLGHRYPDWYSSGLESEIASLHGVSPGQVCAGAGATELIHLIASGFLGAGDEVVTAYPSYSQIEGEAAARGASVVQVPLDANHVVDLTAVAAAVGPATRLIYLVNPNNPTATVVDGADMEALVDGLTGDAVLVVDEAYHDYVHAPNYESCLRFVDEGRPVIVVRTLSKAYGLAGMRVGYAVGSTSHASLIGAQQAFGMIARPGQAAGIAALGDAQHVADTVALNDQAKALLETGFDGMGLDWIPSETNFMMVDVGTDATGVKNQLAGLGYQVRSGYGMPQHLRVSTGTLAETSGLLDALESILTVGVSEPAPPAFALLGGHPNPFNGHCTLRVSVPDDEPARLTVYDHAGRRVRTLVSGSLEPGPHGFDWDGRDHAGKAVASGVYVICFQQGEFATSGKVTLLK